MNLSTLILFFVFCTNILLLFFIVFQKQRQRSIQTFILILLITIWQGIELYTAFFLLDDTANLLLAVRLGLLPALFFAPTFVWLSYSFFDKWNDFGRWQKFLWWLPAILMSPLVFTKYNVMEAIVEQRQALYEPGILYWFFAIYFTALMFWSLYFLNKNRVTANLVVKKQITYIFVATAVTAISALLFAVLLPLFGTINLYYVVVNITIIFTATLTYALFRHRFYDIRLSFYQIFFDLLRLFLTIVIYYALYYLLEDVTIINFDDISNMLWLFLFIAFSAPVVFNLFSKLIESLLINPAHESSKVEDEVASILRSDDDLNISLGRLAKQVSKIVDYKDFHIYLSRLNDSSIYHQIFPIGERTIARSGTLFVKYMMDNKDILNVAEILYLGQDKDLCNELSKMNLDACLPIFYNKELVGLVTIDNNNKLLSVQQIKFLQQVNKYLDISIGSFLLYQQALVNKNLIK